MGFFDLFKSSKPEESKQLSNEQYQSKRKKEIDILEKKYDLSTVEGINAIPVPKKKQDIPNSMTGQIDYYIILKAGQYEKENQTELALACYRKANELMPVSGTEYPQERYMRLPNYLRKLHRFDEARIEEEKIKKYFEKNDPRKKYLAEKLLSAKQLKTDLVVSSSIGGCCSECAKYRDRVYSISGKDKRFKPIPDILLDPTHPCGITLHPFIYGVNTLYAKNTKKVDTLKYSNRPLVDDRTPEELQEYENLLIVTKKQEEKELNRKDYNWLFEFLPEDCPKSFSGYTRVKNANTEKYQKLVLKAKEKGYTIK